MKIDLSEKIALITGGATGLGKGMALANSNARVIVTSRNLKDIKKISQHKSGKIFGYNLDVTKSKDLEKLYNQIKKKHKKIDIIINNVGHTLDIKDPFTDIKNWKKIMDLNFFTAVNVTNKFIKDMKKRNWGSIINKVPNVLNSSLFVS